MVTGRLRIDRGGGNPFYLEELVRAVAAGRDDVFPDSVLGTVEARLDAEERAGDQRNACAVRSNLSVALVELGDYVEGVPDNARTLSLTTRARRASLPVRSA